MKLVSIVLAGGACERFGGSKLGAILGGRPLLAHALDSAAAASDDIVVVVGHCPDVSGLANDWASATGMAVRIIAAADSAEGMGASLRAGLEVLAPDVDGAFVFLGDMPFIPGALLAQLADALARGAAAAAPTYHGVRGHPVLLGRSLIAQRARIMGDRGASGLLASEPGLVLIEAESDGVLFDIDTPAALAEASALARRLHLWRDVA